MNCIQCKKEIQDGDTITPVNYDGDMVCGMICLSMYKRDKEKFFEEVVHDEKKFQEWMRIE